MGDIANANRIVDVPSPHQRTGGDQSTGQPWITWLKTVLDDLKLHNLKVS